MAYFKKFEQFINESAYSDDEIRMCAWLYFLTFVYPNGMEYKSWYKDKRMGVKCEDALKYYEDKGLVKLVNDKWLAQPGAEEEVIKVFGMPDSRKNAQLDKRFSHLDGKSSNIHAYPISGIPDEIFMKVYQDKIKNTPKKHDLGYTAYEDILTWWKKYQRNSKGWWNKLNQYTGAKGDLMLDVDSYTLYRGILVNDKGYNIGDKIKDDRISWTNSFSMARRFALGNKHWMDHKTQNDIPSGMVGLVLKHTFSYKEILMDTEFIENNHPYLGGAVDFDEDEVIVIPKNREVEINDVIKSTK